MIIDGELDPCQNQHLTLKGPLKANVKQEKNVGSLKKIV
jgi:hypothetical protein